jgi:hypothetical protein
MHPALRVAIGGMNLISCIVEIAGRQHRSSETVYHYSFKYAQQSEGEVGRLMVAHTEGAEL